MIYRTTFVEHISASLQAYKAHVVFLNKLSNKKFYDSNFIRGKPYDDNVTQSDKIELWHFNIFSIDKFIQYADYQVERAITINNK